MFIEPVHMIQMAMYSKLIADPQHIHYYAAIYLILYILYKSVPYDHLRSYMERKEDSAILIPTHIHTYMAGFNRIFTKKNYSVAFRALTHHLMQNHIGELDALTEIVKAEYDGWSDEKNEYALIPEINRKIQICAKSNIYLELLAENETVESGGGGSSSSSSSSSSTLGDHKPIRKYTYRISKPGKKGADKLNRFLEKIVAQYERYTNETKQQMLFEYVSTHKDQDTDKLQLVFNEYPFVSNKRFDKNVFFQGKDDLVRYLRRFKRAANKQEQEQQEQQDELDYERAGVTFKASILLHGKPGCGKSCTIRAALNELGRHGVLVQWSRIKTCSEFRSIFRNTKINGKMYEPGDLCYIFEDFDANENRILKTRKDTVDAPKVDLEVEECFVKDADMKKCINAMKASLANDDELTLDCVLNVLDGIIELHNTVILFTTNMTLDNLDPAFLRSGRIDYIKELGLMKVVDIREMVMHKFDLTATDIAEMSYIFEQIPEDAISPADVQNICFRYGRGGWKECVSAIASKIVK